MNKLLPCPFCGGEAKIVGGAENWTPTFSDPDSGGDPIAVVCQKCECGLHFFDNYSDAITAWNNRTQPNEPLTLSELLEMDCKPVYCVDARGVGAWAIVSATFEECIDGEYGGWEFYSYRWADSDAGWLAYRHKPEQEEQP